MAELEDVSASDEEEAVGGAVYSGGGADGGDGDNSEGGASDSDVAVDDDEDEGTGWRRREGGLTAEEDALLRDGGGGDAALLQLEVRPAPLPGASYREPSALCIHSPPSALGRGRCSSAPFTGSSAPPLPSVSHMHAPPVRRQLEELLGETRTEYPPSANAEPFVEAVKELLLAMPARKVWGAT